MSRLDSTPCPVCGGPIGLQAATATSRFACHHCHWVLASNQVAALYIGLAVGCVTEIVVVLAIYFAVGAFPAVILYWASGGIMVSGGAGFLAYSLALKLRVVTRPVSGDAPEQPFAPTIPLNRAAEMA